MKKLAISQALAALASARVLECDHASRGFHLSVAVAPLELPAAAKILDQQGFFIEAITGVDWLGEQAAPGPTVADQAEHQPPLPSEDSFEVVYDFNHFAKLCRVALRTRMPRSRPEIPTISAIYPGANWHERETHDFFGIIFSDHPDLSPLLLPEDADFHPLCKDYKP
ncbi:MAG: NADH-quinone oxidoreductase subunit C [Desulfobulbaceae bacterium]|nr:MAG: NADH-quinone oxidoreductase subunit C [Desulfobulbaceae bacterium]